MLWKSKLQRCIALSSMKAVYVAASETAKLIVWIDRLLKDVSSVISNEKTPKLYIENQSAIKLIGNPKLHKRSKHIETRYHFMHQLLSEKKIDVKYIPTKDQVVDVFTKGLPSERLASMKMLLGIRSQAETMCSSSQ